MFESLFEFLFKYRPLVFEEGDLTFRPTAVTYLAALAVVAAGVVTLRTYQRVRANSRPLDRAVLTGIRFTILALLLLCLFRPVLVLSRIVPQQNFLAVLVDNSRSMQIADRDGQTRADFVTQQFGSAENSVLAALADRFALRLFSFLATTDRIETVGFLQEGTAPLTCSQAERDMLAEELAARPVWLAAGAGADEFAILTGVHQQVMRRSHRLLLILAPQDPNEGPLLARKLESEGWVVGLRSLEDEPEPEVEIYIADVPGELGLWYRLAPTSFLGGTLSGGPVRNPYEAAALGSAVLYGPRPGPWRESFERLRDAGAARCVSDKQDLTRAVEELLAPDHVARMASAAWDVTTNGAQATDRVVELVLDTLDRKGV